MFKAHLSIRLAFAIFLTAVLIIAVDVGYRLLVDLPQAHKDSELQLKRVVSSIEPVLVETLSQNSERLGQKTLRTFEYYPSIQTAWLLDAKGEAVAAWVREDQTPADDWQEVSFSLSPDGLSVGAVVMELDPNLQAAAIWDSVLSKLYFSLGVLILPLVIMYGWVRRKVTDPLMHLVKIIDGINTENLTSEDFERLRSVKTQGEIRRLNDRFLGLLQTLSQTIASRQQALVGLRQFAETLEEKVTERTRDLQKAKEEAEQAGRAKNDFMTVMTHELRTPLNGILGFTALLQKAEADDRTTMLVNSIGDSASHLLMIVNDIIDYAALEGLESFNNSMFSPLDTMMSACRLFDEDVKQKNISLNYHADSSLLMNGDGQRLMLALRHLISNAVKFTDEGGIEVNCQQKGNQVVFTVADTGSGMDLDNMNAVLQAFSQGDMGLARSNEGIGMGLAIVSRVVEIWGGRLSFSHHEPKGTMVTIVLPSALDEVEVWDSQGA